MCGISGILGFHDSFAVDEATAVRMRDTLTHRGPDDAGVAILGSDRVALGHRRLSIVDLSPAGHQPMANEDGTVWLTYNGEVYNHEELRVELEAKGHRYRSRTDSETIVHLYEELGPRCVERLDGMFAFAIWDARRKELFLARDRLGVKPLSFARLPAGFLFASEPKALLAHPALSSDLDEEAFHHYLTFAFVPPPKTLFQNVCKLAPGERMTVRADGSVEVETYWDPLSAGVAERVAGMSDAEMIEQLRALLRESIRKRMMSDVPYGVFLSGGLDSSTNVALMSELVDEPVRTFSTAPKNHQKYDELRYARLVSARYGTRHSEVRVDEADLFGFLPQLVELQDEPISDWTSIPQHFVTKLARDSGTIVVQVGEGADELFHGYRGYVSHRRIVPAFQRLLPGRLRRAVGRAAVMATERSGWGVRHGEALYDAAHSRLPYWGGALCFRGPLKDRVVRANGYPHPYEIVERHWDEAGRRLPGADLYQRMTYVELKQRLAELLLMRLDRTAMLSSVEGREPYLDHTLVEFALALPPRMKHRNGQGKWILREAVRGELPGEILGRPKQGFGTPMTEWLRGPFGRHAQERVRSSTLAERGLLDYGAVDALFAAHARGRADWSYHLWNLYNVSAWHDRWIAGLNSPPAAPPA